MRTINYKPSAYDLAIRELVKSENLAQQLANAVSDLLNEPRTLEIEHYAETALQDWEQYQNAKGGEA